MYSSSLRRLFPSVLRSVSSFPSLSFRSAAVLSSIRSVAISSTIQHNTLTSLTRSFTTIPPSNDAYSPSSSNLRIDCSFDSNDTALLSSMYYAGEHVKSLMAEAMELDPSLQSSVGECSRQVDGALEILQRLLTDKASKVLTPDLIEPALKFYTAAFNQMIGIIESMSESTAPEVAEKLEMAAEQLNELSVDEDADETAADENGEEQEMDEDDIEEAELMEQLEQRIEGESKYPRIGENRIHAMRRHYGERPGDDYDLPEEVYLEDEEDPHATEYEWQPPVDDFEHAPRPELTSAFAYGARKSSKAFAVLRPGNGNIWINKRRHALYFNRWTWTHAVIRPLEVTGTLGQYDVIATTSGGGKSGQAGAVRLAIARSLRKLDPNHRSALKGERLLTRDKRVPERKKFGQPGARAKFPWLRR